MKRLLARALLVVALVVLGCGGDDDPAGPGNGGGGGGGGGKTFKAKIDGAAWTAMSASIQVTGSPDPRLATIVISGVDNTGKGIILSLSVISGPGTYPLGVNPGSNAGGTGSVLITPDSWLTPLNGAAGSVVITTRTATRIVGTFEFDASPLVGAAADVEVTDGEFDITVAAGLPALPNGGGASVMTATVGGDPWNAATIAQVSAGASFGGTTTEYSINFTGVVAPGVFDLGTGAGKWQAIISRTGTSDSWSTASVDSVGTILFATVLPGRMQGFFSGTFPSLGVTPGGPLTIADGFFSIYIGP